MNEMEITGIILAGGSATRMGDLCAETPKSMLHIGGKPFLHYLVDWLSDSGINEILLSTGHMSVKIEEYFNQENWRNKGVRIIKETSPMGTGGATKFACRDCTNENILLCNGDTICDIDIRQFYTQFTESTCQIVAILTLNHDVPNQGAVLVENGIIVEFNEGDSLKIPYEKGTNLRASSTGYYFLKKSVVLSNFPDGQKSLEREILPSLVSKRMVGAINNRTKYFYDYGNPEKYAYISGNPEILTKALKLKQGV